MLHSRLLLHTPPGIAKGPAVHRTPHDGAGRVAWSNHFGTGAIHSPSSPGSERTLIAFGNALQVGVGPLDWWQREQSQLGLKDRTREEGVLKVTETNGLFGHGQAKHVGCAMGIQFQGEDARGSSESASNVPDFADGAKESRDHGGCLSNVLVAL